MRGEDQFCIDTSPGPSGGSDFFETWGGIETVINGGESI